MTSRLASFLLLDRFLSEALDFALGLGVPSMSLFKVPILANLPLIPLSDAGVASNIGVSRARRKVATGIRSQRERLHMFVPTGVLGVDHGS